jgi:tRNA(fMet)-specific endonuclease VapC
LTLLDTNTIIHCLKGREPASSRFRSSRPAEIAIPSVVAYELEYGTLRVASLERRRILARMLDGLRDVPFDRAAARETALLRADLERRGLVIGPMDLLIAGTALSRGAILATDNIREFSRVEHLRLDDWTQPSEPRTPVSGAAPFGAS